MADIKIIFDFLKSLVKIIVRFLRSKYRYRESEGFNKEVFIFDLIFVSAILVIGYKFIIFVIKWYGIDHSFNRWFKWFKKWFN